MKHLVIKYFDTFRVEKFLFDTEEEAVSFAKTEDEKSNIYEYEYRGTVEV